MLEALSLDQLRTFIAAADEGSFSAAGRKLRRAQSVVSQTLANLESQLDIQLFDRSSRYPRLTEEGSALLAQARLVVGSMDSFKSQARAIAEGLEPELSVVMDVMFPMEKLTHAVGGFRIAFPDTPLRLYVEALGAVVQPVLDGTCRLGISGSMPDVPETVGAEHLLEVPMVTVAAPTHPLSRREHVIQSDELDEHVQLVLTDRSALTDGQLFGVYSSLTWRLADLGAKHAFLKAGFGWGHMPEAMVRDDIDAGRLVRLSLGILFPRIHAMPMLGIYRKDTPPGPAGRWLLEQLKVPCQ
ncbi:LysR family transcriptional regulator [Burkholderia pyrrocinia]|uniref:LysR family transcriptional regulator n=1 Tax=Burkholderia pyrrocinia TaxID=60550 RepID=UPI0030D1CDBA